MSNQLKENINRIKSLISEFYPDDTPDEPGYTGFPVEDKQLFKIVGQDGNVKAIELTYDMAVTINDSFDGTIIPMSDDEEPTLNISYDDETMEYELGEQEGTESGESDDAAGAGTASMGIWDSGVARGVANQITNSKWADSYTTTRGKANPLT